MWVAFAVFSKKFQHICVSLDVNFNESLTNDVVSFEQLGPEIYSQKALSQNVMPRLSLRDRDRALGQLEAGRHADDVAADFGCHVSTMYRLLERHRITGDASDRRHSGRPRVTSVRQERFKWLTHIRNRFQSAAATSRQTRSLNNRRISVYTVRRHLRNAGLRAKRLYCGPR